MVTFIMGHGQYRSPDTFVPAATSIGVYAEVDQYLAITIGMAVLAQEGGYTPRATYASTGDTFAPIHNYRVDPLSPPEYQKMRTANSPDNTIIYIGYNADFPLATHLCTGNAQTCHSGVHGCEGLLAKVKDTDIRLAFCLVPSTMLGLAMMTTTFPTDKEYDKPRKDLAEARVKAEAYYARVQKGGQAAVAAVFKEIDAIAQTPERYEEAAFILASSKGLEQSLILFDARKQRAALGASTFLNYLHALPEEWQQLVYEALKADPKPKAVAPSPGAAPAVAAPTALEAFFGSFFLAEPEQRYTAWKALSDQVQTDAKANMFVLDWARTFVPVIDFYASQAASADQPMAAFLALAHTSGLSEIKELEAQETASYLACRTQWEAFWDLAPATQRLAFWNQLEGNPAARDYMKILTSQGPEDWTRTAQ